MLISIKSRYFIKNKYQGRKTIRKQSEAMNKIIIDHQKQSSTVCRKNRSFAKASFFRNSEITKKFIANAQHTENIHNRMQKKENAKTITFYDTQSETKGEHILPITEKIQQKPKIRCLRNHSQKLIKSSKKNMKNVPMSEVNILQQNKELSLLQENVSLFQRNSIIMANFSFSSTLQAEPSFKNRNKSVEHQHFSQSLKNKQNGINLLNGKYHLNPGINNSQEYIKCESKNRKIVYLRKKNKNRDGQPAHIQKFQISRQKNVDNVELSVEKKMLTAREQSNQLKPSTRRNASSFSKLSSQRKTMSGFMNRTEKSQENRMGCSLSDQKRGGGSKINFIKKEYQITPWD